MPSFSRPTRAFSGNPKRTRGALRAALRSSAGLSKIWSPKVARAAAKELNRVKPTATEARNPSLWRSFESASIQSESGPNSPVSPDARSQKVPAAPHPDSWGARDEADSTWGVQRWSRSASRRTSRSTSEARTWSIRSAGQQATAAACRIPGRTPRVTAWRFAQEIRACTLSSVTTATGSCRHSGCRRSRIWSGSAGTSTHASRLTAFPFEPDSGEKAVPAPEQRRSGRGEAPVPLVLENGDDDAVSPAAGVEALAHPRVERWGGR